MEASEAFCLALGVVSPWYFERLEIVEDVLHIYLGLDSSGLKVHAVEQREWRHADFFQYQCHIHAKVPRLKQQDGNPQTLEVPWARPGSGFTRLFEIQARMLAAAMPVRLAATHLRIHDTRLWRILKKAVSKAHELADYSNLKRIGLDETASKKGHHYISVFADIDLKRVVFACEGRGADAIGEFKAFLKLRNVNPQLITEFSCDMSPSYLSGLKTYFPKASVTLDKYHLIAMLNKAVDQTRKAEAKTYSWLKGSKYLWLKNFSKLKPSAQAKLKEYLDEHQFSQTTSAYSLKLQFQELFKQESETSRAFFFAWIAKAFESGIDEIVKVATTFFNQRELILRWFQTRISNGLLEGFHSVLQATKNKARGYRNPQNLITMSYLLHGKLQFETR